MSTSSWDGSGQSARIRWRRIMPVVFVTYSLGYLDRANYGFAAAGGMAADLKITAATSALAGALFFLGYFFFQIPGAILAERRSIKTLIFFSLLLWGVCASLSGMVSQAGWLLAIRFVLGVTEAAVLPAMLIYLGRWFTRPERARANTFLILGNPVTVLWMSVVSGYLVRAVGWRWMFILEGSPAAVWAVIWWLTISETPQGAAWLTASQKQQLAADLAKEQAGLRQIKDYRAAFGDPVVLVLCAQYLFWSLGVYGFVLWLPSILRERSGLSIVQIGWLSAAPYLLAIGAMLVMAWIADKTLHRHRVVWICLLVAAGAFAAAASLGSSHFWAAYGTLVVAGAAMYAPYGPFFAIIPEVLPRNVAGGATALINGMGALGSFGGTYFVGFLNARTGNARLSYLCIAAALLLASGLTVVAKKIAQRPR